MRGLGQAVAQQEQEVQAVSWTETGEATGPGDRELRTGGRSDPVTQLAVLQVDLVLSVSAPESQWVFLLHLFSAQSESSNTQALLGSTRVPLSCTVWVPQDTVKNGTAKRPHGPWSAL